MGKFIKAINIFFENLPALLRKQKLIVVSLIVVITVLLGAGVNRIIMDNSLDSFFKENDPVKKEYDRFKMVFGGMNIFTLFIKQKTVIFFQKNPFPH